MSAASRTTITDDDLWEACPQCKGQKTNPYLPEGAGFGGQCTHCNGIGKRPTETARAILRLLRATQQHPGLLVDLD
jgi:hypothetical protein